jgi:hypothetical protein
MPSFDCHLNVPRRDLPTLSFCAVDSDAIAEWIGQLPLANTLECAGLLHRAVSELTRLDVAPANRFEAIEAIRPSLHYICARLDRASSNGGGTGEGHAQLAQTLQTQLAQAYKSVVRDLIAHDRSAADRDLTGHAIHRAISDSSRTLVRAAQYYSTVPSGTWYELNHLLHLSERLGISQESFGDDENHATAPLSIADAYLRAALFALSKPNQLRPHQLGTIFNALEQWTPETAVGEVRDDALFVVDLEADAPPRYRDVVDPDAGERRSIRTDVLVYGLEAYLAEIATDVPVPDFVDAGLLRHLVHAWGVLRKRSFRRTRAAGPMKVCVGLRNVHYFVSGGVEFARQVGPAETVVKREVNPFVIDTSPGRAGTGTTVTGDVWDHAFDVRGRMPVFPSHLTQASRPTLSTRIAATAQSSPAEYPMHDAEIVDTSPAGFCIQWRSNAPQHLVSGELVAVREARASRWVLAVVRWIRREDAVHTGIELLSPRAIPVAVRLIQKRGGRGEHARALLLPEIPSIAQPAMVIIPSVPFRESQKISIERQGVHAIAQLMRRVRTTESFTQFTFRMLDGYLESVEIALNMDSLWDMIGADPPDNPDKRT